MNSGFLMGKELENLENKLAKKLLESTVLEQAQAQTHFIWL